MKIQGGDLVVVLAAVLCLPLADLSKATAGQPSWVNAVGIEEGLRRFPDDDIVTLLQRKTIEVKKSGDRVAKEYRVVHVRESSADRMVDHFCYGNAYRKLERFEGRRIDQAGRSRTFTAIALQGAVGRVDETWTYGVRVDELSAGDIAAFELEYVDKSPGLVSDRFLAHVEHPVVRMEYEVRLPRGWKGRVVEVANGQAAEERTEVTDEGAQLCIVEDIPKSTSVALQPSGSVGLMAEYWDAATRDRPPSWHDISDWYRELSESALQDTVGLRSLSQKLLGESLDTDETALLSRAVRDRIRYEKVYLGDGGYRPHGAMNTWSQAWGDCKDKGLLLVGLLRASGLEAFPVLVGIDQRTEPPVRTVGAFNHVIVAVPDGDDARGFRFIDPTAQTVPFGRLPRMDEGARALLVGAPGEQTLFRLPRSAPRENRSEVFADFQVRRGSAMSGRVRELHTGQPAFRLRSILATESEKQRREHVQERVAGLPSVVDSLSISGLAVDEDTLVIEYTIVVSEVVNKVQSGLLVWPNPLTARIEPLFPEKERQVPVDFRYPFQAATQVTVAVPAGLIVQSIPEPYQYESEVASYLRVITSNENRLEWRREVEVREPWIGSEDYSVIRSWDEAVVAGDRSRVVLARP